MMGEEKNYLEMRPSLLKRVNGKDYEEASKDMIKGRKNISRFFESIYTLMYGGKIMKEGKEDTKFILEGIQRSFSPDIVLEDEKKIETTEIKAYSIRTSAPHCSFKQISNYFFSLLEGFDNNGKIPNFNYAFFRYGNNKHTGGLDRLGNKDLVKRLSEEDKSLLIIPPNLLSFLFSFSRIEEKDRTSTHPQRDSYLYLRPRASALKKLYHNGKGIDNLIEDFEERREGVIDFSTYGELEDFCVDKLLVEHSKSPEIRAKYYGKTRIIEPFNITKYSLSEQDHLEWLDHFSKNHERILGDLGLRDIISEKEEEEKILEEKIEEDLEDAPF